jgi:hypothetical protein
MEEHDPSGDAASRLPGLSAETAAQAEAIATGSRVTADDIVAVIHEIRAEREEHLMSLFENRGREPE